MCTSSEATSLNCCNGFIRAWLARYGCPETITSDNGSTFTANLWTDLNRVLGIEVNYVPRYHQSTNGAIERQHRTLKESIKASLYQMGDTHRSEWMQQLPFTLLGRRVALQPDLQASAADLTLGAAPVLPGVFVEEDKSQFDPHTFLKTLQIKDAQPPIPMSRNSAPDRVYMPDSTQKATHVYVKTRDLPGECSGNL